MDSRNSLTFIYKTPLYILGIGIYMEQYCKILCIASRGRGLDNLQHFEVRLDRCTNTITSVIKDAMFLLIKSYDK